MYKPDKVAAMPIIKAIPTRLNLHPLLGDVTLLLSSLLLLTEMALRQIVQLILLPIELVVGKPEPDTAHKGQNSGHRVIPHQQRILRQADHRLSDGRGEGVHEQCHGLDEGAHVNGRLGERVFERGDRGEDLRNATKHIGHGLHPDGDVAVFSILFHAQVGFLAARSFLVDIVLRYGSGDHRAAGNEEAGGDPFDGREVDSHPAEPRVYEPIHDRDGDDEGKWV